MRKPRSRPIFYLGRIFIAVLLLLQGHCKKSSTEAPPPAQKGPPAEERMILEVGQASYSEADFNKYVRDEVGTEAKALEPVTLSSLYDEFIDQKLFLQAARDAKITLSVDEKKQYLAKQAEESWSDEDKKALLESDSGPLFEKMMVEKYSNAVAKDIKVDDAEVRRYYDLHKSEFFLPERVGVSQILLPSEAKAVDVWEKARMASEEDFRALAISESVGPEASKGGDMGIFQRGQLPQEFEDAIFSLQEGEVSPVIESSYGFHIFRVDRRYQPEWTPFEKASTSIKLNLLEMKVKALVSRRLEELKESLDWAAFPENLSFPYQRKG